MRTKRDGVWIVYSIDWQATNRYATSLAKLTRDYLISNGVLAQDRES
ncbi:hypothetical protein ES703_83464 [subsurface metagenome]